MDFLTRVAVLGITDFPLRFVGIFIFILTLLLYRLAKIFVLATLPLPTAGHIVCTNINVAKSILDGSFLRETPSHSRMTPLESRAIPNERLIKAFQIENSFTTTDEEWHKEFRTKIEGLLNLATGDWTRLREYIQTTISLERDIRMKKNNRVYLGNFLQSVVMKMVLKQFFTDGGVSSLNATEETNSKAIAAEKINTLWIQSKSGEISKTDNLDLTNALLSLLPDIDVSSPRENPLNIILPAYETLWRVVFRCFVEVQFRSSPSDRERYRNLLHYYLREPTTEMLAKTDDNGFSVTNIVNETLRIYPPTKRIHRAIPAPPQTDLLRVVAIDVEYFHHDSATWGVDSTEFRPQRWNGPITESQKKSFLPFGAKPFACPAGRTFAPKVIGLLVAALAEEFGDDQWGWAGEGLKDGGLASKFNSNRPSVNLPWVAAGPWAPQYPPPHVRAAGVRSGSES
ncbi:hypothetical protein RUND412_001230 [Rhizina undulata]